MTDLEIITTLAAANPLPREAAERADLNAAERELLEELRALPTPGARSDSPETATTGQTDRLWRPPSPRPR